MAIGYPKKWEAAEFSCLHQFLKIINQKCERPTAKAGITNTPWLAYISLTI